MTGPIVDHKHDIIATVQKMELSIATSNRNQRMSGPNQHSRAAYGRRME